VKSECRLAVTSPNLIDSPGSSCISLASASGLPQFKFRTHREVPATRRGFSQDDVFCLTSRERGAYLLAPKPLRGVPPGLRRPTSPSPFNAPPRSLGNWPSHTIQAAIERGLAASQAALMRKLGLTHATVPQLFDLMMLAATLQEQVLALFAVVGAEPLAERTIQAATHAGM